MIYTRTAVLPTAALASTTWQAVATSSLSSFEVVMVVGPHTKGIRKGAS